MSNFLLNNGKEVILPRIIEGDYQAHWKDEGFTNEQHHTSFEATSSSWLKHLDDSPYTYLEHLKAVQNGRKRKETKSMKFGTISHLIVLEPAEFRRRVVLAPKIDRRTNKGKDEWDLFMLDQAADAVIFPNSDEGENEYNNFVGVVNAIAHHTKARDIFQEGVAERSGFFKCPVTNILSRIRPDWMGTNIEGGLLVDFKTAASSKYDFFQKQCDSYLYHVQMSMYREGYKEINGNYPKAFAWVVCQNTFPFEVAIFTASEAMLSHGDRWYPYYMNLLKECLTRRKFPQRQTEVETMVPTKWSMDRIMPRTEDILWE